MAGICPFKTVGVLTKPDAKMMFVPQRAYVPQGTLRQAICYPDIDVDEQTLITVMHECYLQKWTDSLDVVSDWQAVLSPGELQRVAFVRVFLTKPDVLFLDEATAALDEAIEQALYTLVIAKMPSLIMVSIGHRSTLHCHHNKQLILSQGL